MSKDQALERQGHAEAQVPHGRPAADHRLRVDELNTALAAILAGAGAAGYDEEGDTLMEEPNAALDLIRAGRLDDAEAAARALLAGYPDAPDGWERLGMVHEARGERREAVDCYRRVVAFLERNPDYAEPAFKDRRVSATQKVISPSST